MKKALLLALVLVACCWNVRGESDTSHHRAVYAEVNDSEASLQKVTASIKGDSNTISLTGWIDGGEVRKIVAKPGSMGNGADEYYLEKEKPLFVFSTYKKTNPDKGKVTGKVEERIYFEDGCIVKWLSNDEGTSALHGEDYESQAQYLNSHCEDFVAALKKRAAGSAQSAYTVDGVFLGIEQGDYAHWKMRTTTGKELSLFILRPDATVEKVLEDPETFVGRKCRVKWEKSTQDIPEAGGKVKIEQILGVDWTGRK